MSKKLVRIWVILAVFLLLAANISILIPSFFLWEGNLFALWGKYPQAHEAFSSLENYVNISVSDRRKVVLNQANTYYQNKNYAAAIPRYNSLSGASSELGFRANHNLGNAWYRLGEKVSKLESQTIAWSYALESYDKALKIEKNAQTKANRDFVAGKLKELLKELQKKSQEGSNGPKNDSDSASGSGASSSSGSQDSSTGAQSGTGMMKKDGQTWKNTGQFNGIGASDKTFSQMSSTDRERLESYVQFLQQLQKEKGGYLASPQSNQQSLLEQFFGNDPIFSSSPNGSNESQTPDW